MSSRPSSKFLARASSVRHFTYYLHNMLTTTDQAFNPNKPGGAAQSSSSDNETAVREFQAVVSDHHIMIVAV
jgi:hypothetical protein